jgi:hypothetical protein
MASLLASNLAGLIAIALEQRPAGGRLSELARAAGTGPSAAQRALHLLTASGVVLRGAHGVYRLDPGAPADALIALASAVIPATDVLAAIARANDGVEFAGIDEHGLLVVIAWTAGPQQVLLLKRALSRLPGVPVTAVDHDNAREEILIDPGLRERAALSRVLTGSVDRSFPDRARHGTADAEVLGELNPSIARPSRRALRELGRQFGLQSLRVFGSAVRSDARPDSDVDVMIKLLPGTRLGLFRLAELRARLETLFERDVDLVSEAALRPAAKQRATAEGVLLYGPS